ncbi:unnamed protein product [Adineta ricciae]|uniref:NAD(P)(+)--arginine ADP-ribosyltransferase n=1 Tax=Adineta ricciae TaxID=249248 RepID=A0A816FE71_ADIRI|nr:unnamed protein product [Adineta ricciae]
MEWDTAADKPRSSLYSQLNRTLKQVDRTKLRPWFRYLKLFLTALAKLPCAPHQTVWRGVRKDQSADYPPGAEVTWWAFSSCTTSLNVLESDLYLGNAGTRTLFSIETINGRTIRSHSHFTTEDEILLLPGTYLEVKSRLNPAPDLHIVHLQQKVPPHILLEPPFPGAQLLPIQDNDRALRKTSHVSDNFESPDRRWFQKKRILFGIGVGLALVILAIVLGVVLGTRNKNQSQTTSTPTMTTTVASTIYFNGTIPQPVSVADAFYSFDGNVNDLYSQRSGEVIGGPVTYVQGYVAYGQAVALTQSTATQINIKPGFDLNTSSSFTIEGFFMLKSTVMTATLVQLTPTVQLNLLDGTLAASLGSSNNLMSNVTLSTDQWHHLSFVFNVITQSASLSIDGTIVASKSAVQFGASNNNTNSTIIVGIGYQGYIDQLSIILNAKSPQEIVWDATVSGYYPLHLNWLLDYGPNGNNATASGVTPKVPGWRGDALNFSNPTAFYQATGFTALGTAQQPFSVSFWLRTGSQPGVFLTVANAYTCLLVIGLQNDRNKLVVYLPNATSTGEGINIVGPEMPPTWTNVAFTWSSKSRANLYTSTFLQGTSADATNLNNARGMNNSSPMTLTLGHYSGPANCAGIQGVNTSQAFMGTIDEVFVFSRELHDGDLQALVLTLPI